jgi:hypothetical protein
MGGAQRIVEMMARDGIALTVLGDMARAWPSVWKNAEAARYTLKKLFIGKLSSARSEGRRPPTEQVGISLLSISLSIGKFPLAPILYRRAVAGAHLAVAFFDPRHRPNPSAWLREKQGVLAESLHYLWRPGEIPPLAGEAGVVANAAVVKPEAKLPWSTPAVEEIFPTPEEVAAFWKLPPVIEGADPVADAKVPTSAPKVT